MSSLRKRPSPYTTIDNSVAEDSELSFRARGILVYLLAKPDGWAVRSEAIARDGKEGRDAVQTALRELGARGHYRIVRYREGGPGGVWKTETQVSHERVSEWAAEWTSNGGGPVTVKASLQVSPGTGFSGSGSADDGSPETGFPGAGDPGFGDAASGESAAASSPLSNPSDSPSSLRSDGATSDDASRPDLKVVSGTEAPEPTIEQRAERMQRAWWDWLLAERPTLVPSQTYIAVKKIVVPALASGRPERLVEAGLNILVTERRAISQGTLATAMTQAARLPSAPEEFRPWADGEPTQRRRSDVQARPNAQWDADPTGGFGPAALGQP